MFGMLGTLVDRSEESGSSAKAEVYVEHMEGSRACSAHLGLTNQSSFRMARELQLCHSRNGVDYFFSPRKEQTQLREDIKQLKCCHKESSQPCPSPGSVRTRARGGVTGWQSWGQHEEECSCVSPNGVGFPRQIYWIHSLSQLSFCCVIHTCQIREISTHLIFVILYKI